MLKDVVPTPRTTPDAEDEEEDVTPPRKRTPATSLSKGRNRVVSEDEDIDSLSSPAEVVRSIDDKKVRPAPRAAYQGAKSATQKKVLDAVVPPPRVRLPAGTGVSPSETTTRVTRAAAQIKREPALSQVRRTARGRKVEDGASANAPRESALGRSLTRDAARDYAKVSSVHVNRSDAVFDMWVG